MFLFKQKWMSMAKKVCNYVFQGYKRLYASLDSDNVNRTTGNSWKVIQTCNRTTVFVSRSDKARARQRMKGVVYCEL